MDERDFQAMQSVVWAKGKLKPKGHSATPQPKFALSAEEVIAYFKGEIRNDTPPPERQNYTPADFWAIRGFAREIYQYQNSRWVNLCNTKPTNKRKHKAALKDAQEKTSFYLNVVTWAEYQINEICKAISEKP